MNFKKILLFILIALVSFSIMGQYSKNDFHYDVSLDRIAGHEKIWKFGEGTITTTPTTVWMGSSVQVGLYVYPAVAYLMDIVSDNVGDTTQSIVIQGLDKHWKKQEEVILITGLTPVTTQYKYLRINRMAVLGGGSLLGSIELTETTTTTPVYGFISDGGFDRNQTQQAFVSIPMGHTLLAESVDMTSFEAKKTNIYIVARDYIQAEELALTDPPFRVQLNWNLFNSTYQPISRTPIPVTEKIDLELRGFTENATDQVTSILQGVMIQNNSVPIDITSFASTPDTNTIGLTWDQFTPAEEQDQQNFLIEYKKTSNSRIFTKEVATGEASTTITGLRSDTEYQITIYFIGYDRLKSNPVSLTVSTTT